MIRSIEKLKIPTLLGLGILLAGIAAGVFLVLKEQGGLNLQASPDINPEEVTVSNITDTSASISWITKQAVEQYISYGLTPSLEKTALDSRDERSTMERKIHFVTLKNLLPNSNYQYKITAFRFLSEQFSFKTSPPISPNNFGPVTGTVLDQDTPLDEGIAYLNITSATTQSALIKEAGSFIIPVSYLIRSDLSEIYPVTDETVATLKIKSLKGEASATFKLKREGVILPPIKLGQNLDLVVPEPTPLPSPSASPTASDLATFDFNQDGKINAADNAIMLRNFGKSPKEKKTDLNKDGVVDQKDLDLLYKKMGELGIILPSTSP